MPNPGWLTRTHVITTPESVDFAYDLAGPAHRALAWCIDGAIILVLWIGVVVTTAIFMGGAGAFLYIATFVLQVGYFMVLEALWHGQTPGKKVAGIRVLDSRGFRMTFAQAAVRNLFRFIDSLPFFYLVGGITLLANRRGSRLGDLAAGTIVVRVPYVPSPERLLPAGQRDDALLGDFALGDRVRRLLRSPEKDLLVSLAIRRERLEDRARLRLFEASAEWFSKRLEIERPSTMSAETYILNLAAIAHVTPAKTAGLKRP